MGNLFSGSEVVEVGVQIEKNGKVFYDELEKKSKSDKAKGIFKHLSGEEEKHIATFQKILNSVQKYEPTEAYPGEYFSYMNSLASEHIFTRENKGSEMAQSAKDDKEAVDLGIAFEKDSIVFYEGMKKVVPEYDHKLVDALINQEENHLKQLSDLKKTL